MPPSKSHKTQAASGIFVMLVVLQIITSASLRDWWWCVVGWFDELCTAHVDMVVLAHPTCSRACCCRLCHMNKCWRC